MPDVRAIQLAKAALRAGIELLLAPTPTLERCLDKYALYQACHREVPCPRTTLAGSGLPGPGPWIAKPRSGSGSRGVRLVQPESDFSDPAFRITDRSRAVHAQSTDEEELVEKWGSLHEMERARFKVRS